MSPKAKSKRDRHIADKAGCRCTGRARRDHSEAVEISRRMRGSADQMQRGSAALFAKSAFPDRMTGCLS